MRARSLAFVVIGLVLSALGMVGFLRPLPGSTAPFASLLAGLGTTLAAAGFIGLVFAPTMERILREVRRPRDPEAGRDHHAP